MKIIYFFCVLLSLAGCSTWRNNSDFVFEPFDRTNHGTYYTMDEDLKTSVGGFAGSGSLNRSTISESNHHA